MTYKSKKQSDVVTIIGINGKHHKPLDKKRRK